MKSGTSMMQRAAIAVLAALACLPGVANSQEALANEYGYKLAGKTAQASYFLSGIRRGAEPDSVEAWIWTVLPAPEGDGSEAHDAVAQRSVLRCEGRSIEPLKTESYLAGAVTGATVAPPQLPADVAGTPMEAIWKVACDMGARFSAETVMDLSAVYAIAKKP